VVPAIERHLVTKALLAYLGPELEAIDVLLGRGTAPQSGGWQNGGQPGTGTFLPYAVLKTGMATSPAAGERDNLAMYRTSWELTYQVATHHRLDSLVDETAYSVRQVVLGFPRADELVLDGVAWTVQRISVPRLGPTVQDRSTDPPHWQVDDDVSLHVSKVSRG
jgi:hypothetical protein